MAVQALGATLFVLLPTLLARVGHAALCVHWLILWAMLLASRSPALPPGRRFPGAQWAALGLVSGMTQPYLTAMVLPMADDGQADEGFQYVGLGNLLMIAAAALLAWRARATKMARRTTGRSRHRCGHRPW